MTERLTALLHDEADRLDVPPPAAQAVLAQGRRLRRRRSLTTAGATAAVLAVVGGGVALGTVGGADRAVELPPAARTSTYTGAVFSIGTRVYWDDGRSSTVVDDAAVKSLHSTSAGVLVRHGENPWSDGGGPQRFSLVTEDGVRLLDVTLEEVVPSTDPGLPFLAWAEVVAGRVEIVVRDVTTDAEVARVAVPGDFGWGGWSAPPVALVGDRVYVGSDDVMRVVDWRTGEVTTTDALGPGYPDISGGRAVAYDGRRPSVIDVATGEVLYQPSASAEVGLDLSPDGRHATVTDFGVGPDGFTVVDVDERTEVMLPGEPYTYGWTAEGDLFRVDGTTLTVCTADEGRCAESQLDLKEPPGESESFDDDLVLGGRTYES